MCRALNFEKVSSLLHSNIVDALGLWVMDGNFRAQGRPYISGRAITGNRERSTDPPFRKLRHSYDIRRRDQWPQGHRTDLRFPVALAHGTREPWYRRTINTISIRDTMF